MGDEVAGGEAAKLRPDADGADERARDEQFDVIEPGVVQLSFARLVRPVVHRYTITRRAGYARSIF